MKVVFVCSPYRGAVEENVALAKRVCRKAVLEGYSVVCPHIFFTEFLDDRDAREREIGILAGLKLLELADEIWVVDGKISSGMAREIARAGELGIPMKCVCDPRAAEEHLLSAVISEKE